MSTEAQCLSDELAQLRQENARLRAERQQFLEERRRQTRTIEQLQHRLQQLLRRLYGRSSEKIDPNQMLLFDALLKQLAPEMPSAEPAPSPSPEPSPSAKRGHGRRRLPSDLPRRTVIHDLPEEEKPCPCCGRMRHVIGRETSEQLDYVPAN